MIILWGVARVLIVLSGYSASGLGVTLSYQYRLDTGVFVNSTIET